MNADSMLKKITIGIVGTALCFGLCLSAYKLWDIYSMRSIAKNSYNELTGYVNIEKDNQNEVQEIDEGNKEVKRHIYVDFESLKKINDECIGWLYLEDSVINLPVTQHNDNDYYLYYLYDKTENANGSLFLDYRNSPDVVDDNNLIYGHRMVARAMFNGIPLYKTQSYYDTHPYFYYETPDAEYRLEVFAGYETPSISDAYLIDFNEVYDSYVDSNRKKVDVYRYNESVPTFDRWYEDVMNKNLIKTNIQVNEEDRIFTFSTCDGTTILGGRFVLHCKAVNTADEGQWDFHGFD